MEAVTLLGVVPVGPENFLCALLQRSTNGRVIPVWLPPFEGAQLAGRIEGWNPARPRTVDALASVIRDATQGLETIEIASYYNGTFMANVTLQDGTEIDVRASDALLLAVEMDVEIGVDETVASQAAIYLSPEDARAFFGDDVADAMIDPDTATDMPVSASGDERADRDFEELMRNFGVERGDFDTHAHDTDGTDDEEGTGGEKEP